jgi:signal transduction histidine kinase
MDPLTLNAVMLAPLIEKAIATVGRQAGSTLDLSARIPPGLAVLGTNDELYQVLLNLLFNARDAMPDGGSVQIDARAIHFEAAAALARHLAAAGDYVEIAITDSGVGMDEATLARVFEPFFTTKLPGKGTGLGLAMVHNVVRAHGGTVAVESVVKHGTTFRILLPAVRSKA